MVLKKIKYKKIAIVIFLTVLIWVWADLALDESYPISSVALTISNSRENLWVSFSEKKSVQITDIKIKGPVSQISRVKQRLNDNSLTREFFIDAEQQGMTTPGKHELEVQDILRQSIWIQELGLTVESCSPTVVDVNVVELVSRDLTVQCLDENGNRRDAENIEPQKINMFVPPDWSGTLLTAYVDLSRGDIEKARMDAIPKTPYITLAPGQTREAASQVKIRMPPEDDRLLEFSIPPNYSVALSPNLIGKYSVVVTNEDILINTAIEIRATQEARDAFVNQQLAKMTLHIRDSDAEKIEEEKTAKVFLNFPEEYVRSGEIELKDPQNIPEARYKLIPIGSEPSSSDGSD